MQFFQSDSRTVKLENSVIGRFNKIEYYGSDVKSKQAYYKCTCICGNIKTVAHGHLQTGHTKSCGCLNQENRTKHNQSDSYLYDCWVSIKQRCLNPNNPSYKDYGARGITVSSEISNSFSEFLRIVGNRPTPEHSLDRIDVNRGYEEGNLRWATNSQQSQNKRKQTNNKTGVTGVVRAFNRNIEYYIATVQFSNNKIRKYFSISKLGEDRAFELAIKERDRLLDIANKSGASFTASHGK